MSTPHALCGNLIIKLNGCGCVEYANNAGIALGTRSVTDDSDVILLLVHYIALDTVSEAVVTPLDDSVVDWATIFAVDNDRHQLHRHPVS